MSATSPTPLSHVPVPLRSRLVGSTICYPLSVDASFSLERALEGLAGVGFRLVELFAIKGYCEHVSLDDESPAAATRLQAQLERHGLEPVVLNFATHLDTDAGVATFERAARLAERLGSGIVVANVESVSSPEREAAFFERVPRLIAAAERHGVVLALETHGGLVSTAREGADLVDRIGSDRIRVTYDIANVVGYGGVLPDADLEANRSRLRQSVAYVHLKDKADLSRRYDYPPFGDGILDFPAVLATLDTVGYDGLMAVEVELDGKPSDPETVDAALARSLAYLATLAGAEDVAR